jgi:hypothetical protein
MIGFQKSQLDGEMCQPKVNVSSEDGGYNVGLDSRCGLGKFLDDGYHRASDNAVRHVTYGRE